MSPSSSRAACQSSPGASPYRAAPRSSSRAGGEEPLGVVADKRRLVLLLNARPRDPLHRIGVDLVLLDEPCEKRAERAVRLRDGRRAHRLALAAGPLAEIEEEGFDVLAADGADAAGIACLRQVLCELLDGGDVDAIDRRIGAARSDRARVGVQETAGDRRRGRAELGISSSVRAAVAVFGSIGANPYAGLGMVEA